MDAGCAEDESADLWTMKSCGPDAPTLAPRSRVESANDSGKRARSLGRARSKRKPLRGECPGDPGVTVVTMLMCFLFFAREAAGASSARHSLRPLSKGVQEP